MQEGVYKVSVNNCSVQNYVYMFWEKGGIQMASIIYIIFVLIVQIVAPSYVSILIAIAKIFIPDTVPVIDEVLSLYVAVAKLQ